MGLSAGHVVVQSQTIARFPAVIQMSTALPLKATWINGQMIHGDLIIQFELQLLIQQPNNGHTWCAHSGCLAPAASIWGQWGFLMSQVFLLLAGNW
jgi:hypothetical protein